MSELVLSDDGLPKTFEEFRGQESYFGGEPPLSKAIGYFVVLGFGAFFSIMTTGVVYLNQYFGSKAAISSEHFSTAGRMIKTGLTASVIVSHWTWAATLLQSSNVAWQYGVSGPFWYASGATIQVLLFGVLAINIKKNAPSAHTVAEIVNARWGRTAHLTFLFFCFSANIIVTAMLLLGGAATVEALTGMSYELASFLIPWGVILYTASGGLQATFLACYLHTGIIFAVLMTMVFLVYIKAYSSDQIYDLLQNTISKSDEECAAIFSYAEGHEKAGESFFGDPKDRTYSCGPIEGNRDGSYLTMISSGGLMFGIINIVGNFGTVFADQSYWQSAIAARPESAARGYLLGGLCWFSIPFSLATSLGLASSALMLPITRGEAGSGLVPPAVATHLMGDVGASLILIMLFMAIVSTGSAESIAVSSLVAYDIYREYINKDATGEQILFVARVVIVVFGIANGLLAILLNAMGLNLGWVYLFMGIVIGSAVVPLWNMMTWTKASGTGAVLAAWGGFFLAVIVWLIAAQLQSGKINIDTLGTDEVMLSGNLVSIISSGIIHYVYSVCVDPQDYDFAELDKKITLVEQDLRGLTADEQDPVLLAKTEQWITRRGWVMTIVLVIIWPLLSVPAGVFSKGYFSFWVLIAIAWGFGAAIIVVVLPITESSDDISRLCNGVYYAVTGKKAPPTAEAVVTKQVEAPKDEPYSGGKVIDNDEEEVSA